MSLDPTARRRGLGRELITRSTARAAAELGLDAIRAKIKDTNAASRRAFAASGYTDEAPTGDEEDGIVVLRWSRRVT